MKKSRLIQMISGIIIIVAGICEIIYQFNNIKILNIIFVAGLIIYFVLFIVYFFLYKKEK